MRMRVWDFWCLTKYTAVKGVMGIVLCDEVLKDGRGEGDVDILPKACKKSKYLLRRQVGKRTPSSGNSLSKGSEVCDSRKFQRLQV